MSGTGRTGDGHGRLGSMLSGLAVAVGLVLFLGGFAWGALVYKPYIVPTESMTPTVNAGTGSSRSAWTAARCAGVTWWSSRTRPGTTTCRWSSGSSESAATGSPAARRAAGFTVNGKPIEEPYLQTEGLASVKNFTAEVPKGQLFLLGDERSGSLDSRVHLNDPGQGSVPRSDVQARVDAIAWPMDGMIERPQAFAALPGGVSAPGPLKLQLGAVVAGVVLIFGGTAYGPIAARSARRRNGQDRRVPAGAH